jgi:chemotaxis protein MotB
MARRGGRGRRHAGGGGEESNERWLLTYADMITLLMALFMVLFSISSVNISKYQTLQESLKAAFSGDPLPGGKALAHPGSSSNSSKAPTAIDLQSIVPVTASQHNAELQSETHSARSAAAQASAAQQQEAEFAHIKAELEAYARAHHFSKSVHVSIDARGLVIRVLTDDLLFPSGQASLDPRSHSLLQEIAQLLNIDSAHPIDVDGNTDDVPIHSSTFPSNWELSAARASTVVRYLIDHGVSPARLTAVGYADQHPLASDATATGRAHNRRVEIVLKRINGVEGEP